MRPQFKTILIALALGLSFWLIDGVLAYWSSSEAGFWELLFRGAPGHGLLSRCVAIALFLGFAIALSRICTGSERADQTRRQDEEHYRRIVETAHEGICLLGPTGEVTYANERLAQMLGRSPDEMLGECFFDFMDQHDEEEGRQFLAKSSHGSRIESDFRFQRRDGTIVSTLVTVSRFTDDSGNVLGALAMIMDVTERRRVEETLRKQEAQQRRFSEGLTALHEIANELCRATSVDDLCRRSVELGNSRLGFDRLGIWFVADGGAAVTGSFGVDENGELRDERGQTVRLASGSAMEEVFSRGYPSCVHTSAPLLDHQGRTVGEGAQAIASLWDGERIIGFVSTDNLLGHEPIGERESEMLTLYASTVGHLVTLKGVEEKLAHESDLLHALMDNIPDSVYFKDTDSRFTRVNAAQARRLGVADPSDAVGKTDLEFFPAEFAENARADEQQIVRSGRPLVGKEEEVADADGEQRWASATKVPTFDKDGRVEGIVGISRDITEHKRAEQALQRERDFAETLVETAQAIVLVLDTEGRIVRFNPYLEELSGYALEELQGKDWFSTFLPERDHKRVRGLFRKAVGNIQTRGNVNPIITRDGSERLIEWYDKTLRAPEGDVVGLLAVGQDVTDRKRAEEALDRSERMYRGAIETAGAVVYYRNYDTHVFEFVSPGIEALTGCPADEFTPEIWDSFIEEIVPRGDFEGLTLAEARETMREREGKTWRADYRITGRDGTERWVANAAIHISDPQGAALTSLGILLDITDRKHLEDRLRERNKMEAVGTLAGGIAHDFNNLLQGVVGYSHLALRQAEDTKVRHDVQQIRQLADRGAKLVAQLLAFGRKQMLQPTELDLNSLVEAHVNMLRRLIGEDIELRFLPSEDLRTVRADAAQIEQVIMNLASNARDAMPLGGALTITTDNVTFDEQSTPEAVDLVPGEYARLTIADSGRGMDEETLRHAFEPFYTTKGVGEGSGLGLSSAYGIVKQHRGDIALSSEVGKGTTFQICLPCADLRQPVAPSQAPPESGPRGTETILVAEDDDAVRTVVRRALAQHGYAVLGASSAAEAMTLSREHADEIALLLTDVVMPGGSGRLLHDQLVACRPGLGVLYMSGFDEHTLAQYGLSPEDTGFIRKPIDIEELAEKVREVLDA